MIKKAIEKFQKEPKELILLLGYALFASLTFEIFNRPFGHVRNLKIPFDDKIPFVKELILVYHTFFFLVLFTCILIFLYRQELFRELLLTLFVAQILAYIIFMTFQTYVPRYDIAKLGEDFFSRIVYHTYQIDNSYSGAPSLHVCNMCISAWYFSKLPFKKITKVLVISYMILVAATTVLVKQHVFLDIPFGILHAAGCLFIISIANQKLRLF